MREVAAELEQPGAAVQRRQGLDRAAAPGREGVPPRRASPSRSCTSTPGHNFPEVIEFRDRRVAELGERLIVASVQESIDAGRVVEETGPRASRNRLQTTTLLDAIAEHGFDAAFGGARRDEERARAKERIFSFRDDFGQWDPKASAPSCGTSTTGASAAASTSASSRCATGPSSTSGSTSPSEELEVPSIYFAHEREVFRRDGMLYAVVGRSSS